LYCNPYSLVCTTIISPIETSTRICQGTIDRVHHHRPLKLLVSIGIHIWTAVTSLPYPILPQTLHLCTVETPTLGALCIITSNDLDGRSFILDLLARDTSDTASARLRRPVYGPAAITQHYRPPRNNSSSSDLEASISTFFRYYRRQRLNTRRQEPT
jgi:hypothetical protein